jgi:hypothetical protein
MQDDTDIIQRDKWGYLQNKHITRLVTPDISSLYIELLHDKVQNSQQHGNCKNDPGMFKTIIDKRIKITAVAASSHC